MGALTKAMAIPTLRAPEPAAATSTRARTKTGNAWKMSRIRMMISDTDPPSPRRSPK